VNTNFRDHGFSIVGPFVPSDLSDSRNLPDPLHWKKRRSAIHSFTSGSTIEDADAITTVDYHPETPAPLNSVTFPFIPDSLRSLLPLDGFERDLLQVVSAITEIPQSHEWYTQVLEIATNLWRTKFGDLPIVRLSNWLEAFFPIEKGTPLRWVLQLRSNCTALLRAHAGCSQMAVDVYFSDFFRLFLRFGSPQGFAKPITEVSDFSKPARMHRLFSQETEEEEEELEESLPVRFRQGFFFGEKGRAREWIDLALLERWVVTQSRVPNIFTVLVKREPVIVAIQVDYFAVPVPGGKRFSSREPEAGAPTVADSWSELLFTGLRLEEMNGMGLSTGPDTPVRYVGHKEVAMATGRC
jgi:hypothetical protein